MSQDLELLREATEEGEEKVSKTGGSELQAWGVGRANPEGPVPQVHQKTKGLVPH